MAEESRKERRARERKQSKEETKNGVTAQKSCDKETLETRKQYVIPLLIVFLFCIGLSFYVGLNKGAKREKVRNVKTSEHSQNKSSNFGSCKTYGDLFNLLPEQVSSMDIGELNLICGSGLSGTENIDINQCLEQLDLITAMVRDETKRNRKVWADNKAIHQESESVYKMRILVRSIQKLYGIRYDEKLENLIKKHSKSPVPQRVLDKEYYSNASHIFLQGLISGKKRGTCVNMPVLYTAIARRLDYPVRLVIAKSHLLCRWDDGKERFNIEGTDTSNGGMSIYPDEYYIERFSMTEGDIKYKGYMASLTPRAELALFLQNRSSCLIEGKRNQEALVALSQALRMTKTPKDLPTLIDKIVEGKAFPNMLTRRIESRILANEKARKQMEDADFQPNMSHLRGMSAMPPHLQGFPKNNQQNGNMPFTGQPQNPHSQPVNPYAPNPPHNPFAPQQPR